MTTPIRRTATSSSISVCCAAITPQARVHRAEEPALARWPAGARHAHPAGARHDRRSQRPAPARPPAGRPQLPDRPLAHGQHLGRHPPTGRERSPRRGHARAPQRHQRRQRRRRSHQHTHPLSLSSGRSRRPRRRPNHHPNQNHHQRWTPASGIGRPRLTGRRRPNGSLTALAAKNSRDD